MKVRLRAIFAIVIFVAIVIVAAVIRPQSPSELAVSNPQSRASINAATSRFAEIVRVNTPRAALDELRAETGSHDELMRICHSVAHAIGHAAYERYGFSDAMKYQQELCNSGYQHGVIEAYFTSGESTDAALVNACSGKVSGTFDAWQCNHGIGHGLMFLTQNNLPEALLRCDGINDLFAASSCKNGVFMENFNLDEVRQSSVYLDADNTVYPCAEQSDDVKSDCYMYSRSYYLSLHPNDYKGAFAECSTIENRYIYACAEGVGSQAMKDNANHPEIAQQVCSSGPPQMRKYCIRGMVGLFVFHKGSILPAYDLCATFPLADRLVCLATVEDSAPLFSKHK